MIKRYINTPKWARFILFFFVMLGFLTMLTGFFSINPLNLGDDLYKYQWGLHGKSKFVIENTVLSNNYDSLAYENFILKLGNINGMQVVSNNGTNAYIYEDENVSISYEKGYEYYQRIANKRNVVVAVIDTGVDVFHKDLSDNIWRNISEIPNNNIDDDNNGYIDDYYGYNFYDKNSKVYSSNIEDAHGTHSAGIISAVNNNGGIKGIAYDNHIKIMPLKVLGNDLYGKTPMLIEAIKYAENNGADICNISLGNYEKNEELAKTIRDSKMLFVTASGNGAYYQGYNIDTSPIYPASLDYDNIISVANMGIDGKIFESSNYGTTVSVAAPGTFILSTLPGNKYGFYTGTSVSTPFVTALASLIKSAYPNLSNKKIKDVIINSCDTRNDLISKVKSNGYINIYRALQLASMY